MKLLLKLLAGLVLLLVLLVAAAAFLIDPMARTAVEKGVTHATGSETSLESAKIGILAGEVSFNALEIANPPGFQDRPILSVGSFTADWDFQSLFQDEIVVHLLELDGLDLSLEVNGTDSNIDQLIERLRELTAGEGEDDKGEPSDEPTQPPEAPPGEEGPDIFIERIRIADVRTGLTITGIPGIEGSYSAEVPEIIIEELGTGDKSGTLAEWAARIIEQTLVHTQGAGQGTFPAEIQALLSGDLDPLKSKAEAELKKKAGELIEDELPELKEKLEGLEGLEGMEDNEEIKKGKKALDGLLGG
jgi:hypothetical protein